MYNKKTHKCFQIIISKYPLVGCNAIDRGFSIFFDIKTEQCIPSLVQATI